MNGIPIVANTMDGVGRRNPTVAILLVSVLGLFLEMLLIRWIGTEVRIFAYLQNTILIVCFLGLGLGCFTSRQTVNLRATLIPLAILTLLFAIPVMRRAAGSITDLLSASGGILIWAPKQAPEFWVRVLCAVFGLAGAYALMVLVLDVFVPIGRILGRLLDDHPRTICAYSINIAGSLLGTWLFVLVSALYQPPVVWFLIAAMPLLYFLWRAECDWKSNIVLLAVVLTASWFAGLDSSALRVVWSPYQKLVLTKGTEADEAAGLIGDYIVKVNNTGYQGMVNPGRADTTRASWYPPEMLGFSQYDIPPLLHPNPQRMLVVGAGAGNDVAGGIRHGVAHITAVEIDPAIIVLGRTYHPEQPYASSRVDVVNDDARSYFATTEKKFDVIAFGLLDSHTTTALTNARLDHYVYTRESISRAKSLLAEHGVMVLSFCAMRPFIEDRRAGVLRDVFGEEPIAFRVPGTGYGWGGVLYVAGDLEGARDQIAANPQLSALIGQWQKATPLHLQYRTRVATDDWPYIYLETRRIPGLYYLLGLLLIVVFFRSIKRWNATGVAKRWSTAHWHFFFLGAAFLLLEVQNISKASVALGNTWQVNAVIVSGVLAMALLANLLAYRFPRLPLRVVYVGLIGTCLGLYFVDLASFAFMRYSAKALIVGSLTTLPMLFSGVVFITSFRNTARKDEAMGANMAGALAGALLQTISFITGIKALLLIVTGFYVLAIITRPGMRLLEGQSVLRQDSRSVAIAHQE